MLESGRQVKKQPDEFKGSWFGQQSSSWRETTSHREQQRANLTSLTAPNLNSLSYCLVALLFVILSHLQTAPYTIVILSVRKPDDEHVIVIFDYIYITINFCNICGIKNVDPRRPHIEAAMEKSVKGVHVYETVIFSRYQHLTCRIGIFLRKFKPTSFLRIAS